MIPNFIIDDKKLDVDMLRLCWTLVTIAAELYSSYCHSVAVMTSRLNPPSSYNKENVKWSGFPIADTSSIIWACVSNQLQLIRFHVVFYGYHIPSWQSSSDQSHDWSSICQDSQWHMLCLDRYKLEQTSDFQPLMYMECLLFAFLYIILGKLE